MHKNNSIILEIVVARAAPLASILGIPNNPNIKRPLRIMFEMTAVELIIAPVLTCSDTFIMPR